MTINFKKPSKEYRELTDLHLHMLDCTDIVESLLSKPLPKVICMDEYSGRHQAIFTGDWRHSGSSKIFPRHPGSVEAHLCVRLSPPNPEVVHFMATLAVKVGKERGPTPRTTFHFRWMIEDKKLVKFSVDAKHFGTSWAGIKTERSVTISKEMEMIVSLMMPYFEKLIDDNTPS